KQLRTWMGVPLLIEDDGATFLLGVLSFTRKRSNEHDSLFFVDEDAQKAAKFAAILAMALYARVRQEERPTEEANVFMSFATSLGEAGPDEDRIIRTAVRSCRELLQAERCSV